MEPKDFDPKRGIKYIADPIYRYTKITCKDKEFFPKEEITEEEIINSEWLQRLRRIYQMQETFVVYPSGDYCRFQHALGTMHIAGDFARHLYTQLYKNVNFLLSGKLRPLTKEILEKLPSIEWVEELCRLAGLLHDIGHGPFSHSFDRSHRKYADEHHFKKIVTHEDISKKIITEELGELISKIQRSPNGPISEKEKIAAEEVAWLIKPDLKNYPSQRMKYVPQVMSILYSADVLDHLPRDAYHCGAKECETIDISRLLNTSFLNIDEDGYIQFCIHCNSLPALRRFLNARLSMYETVYYHKTSRAAALMVEDLLPRTLELLGFDLENILKDLEKFKKIDDFYILSFWKDWLNDNDIDDKKKEIAQGWGQIANRKISWKEGYRREDTEIFPPQKHLAFFYLKEHKELPDAILQKMKELKSLGLKELEKLKFTEEESSLLKSVNIDEIKIKIDTPVLDVRPENIIGSKETIFVYNPKTQELNPYGFYDYIKNIPVKLMTQRVYCKAGYRNLIDKVSNLVVQERGGYFSRLQKTVH